MAGTQEEADRFLNSLETTEGLNAATGELNISTMYLG